MHYQVYNELQATFQLSTFMLFVFNLNDGVMPLFTILKTCKT